MVFGEERFVALLTDEVSAALVGVHVLLQVVGFEEVFVALGALDLPFTVRTRKQREVIVGMTEMTCRMSRRYVLSVGEHVLLQVLFPDEGAVAEVTLELFCTGVDDHV